MKLSSSQDTMITHEESQEKRPSSTSEFAVKEVSLTETQNDTHEETSVTPINLDSKFQQDGLKIDQMKSNVTDTVTEINGNNNSESFHSKRVKVNHDDTPSGSCRKKKKNTKGPPRKNSEAKKPKNQVDVNVHRIRHLNYCPRSILRIASTPCPDGALSYLALSRQGGSVELVSVDQKWRCVGQVPGLRARDVDALTWVSGAQTSDNQTKEAKLATRSYSRSEYEKAEQICQNQRLYGASRDGTIFEIDFNQQRHTNVIGSGGGGVFCMESLCCKSSGAFLAAGCEDGSVRIFKVDHMSGKISLVSTLPSAGLAILSLAWKKGATENEGVGGSTIFAGIADGTIRRYDCVASSANDNVAGSAPKSFSTGLVLSEEDAEFNYQWRASFRMTLETLGRRTPTRVWSLIVLEDGTVVSGDSIGRVHFWDGHTGTIVKTFQQNDSKADVLDLVASHDNRKVFASGVDTRVVCIERMPQANSSAHEWVISHTQRIHTHDVRSLATVWRDPVIMNGKGDRERRTGKRIELLVSAGVDTKLCTYHLNKFSKYRAKIVYNYPSSVPISLSKEKRILCVMRPAGKIEFHQLAANETIPSSKCTKALDEKKTFMSSIDIGSIHNLNCCNFSKNGEFLSVSDASGLMVFSLDHANSSVIVPTKLDVPDEANMPCSALTFDHEANHLYCASTSGKIYVLTINKQSVSESSDENNLISPMGLSLENVLAGQEDTEIQNYRAITDLCLSPCGTWLVSSRNEFGSGSIQVYIVKKNKTGEVRLQHWWNVPAMESPSSCVKFVGSKHHYSLVIGCANGGFYAYNVKGKNLTKWSQSMGYMVSRNLPDELIGTPSSPSRLAFNPATPNKFLLVSSELIRLYKTSHFDQATSLFSAYFITTICGFVNLAKETITSFRLSLWYPHIDSIVRGYRLYNYFSDLFTKFDYFSLSAMFLFNALSIFLPSFDQSGHTWFCAIDMNQPVPLNSNIFPSNHIKIRNASSAYYPGHQEFSRKRKHPNGTEVQKSKENRNLTICMRYVGMLFMDFLDNNELVIVEQPWVDIAKSLPRSLQRKLYGT